MAGHWGAETGFSVEGPLVPGLLAEQQSLCKQRELGGRGAGMKRQTAGRSPTHTGPPPEEPTGEALLERLGTPEDLVFPEGENLVGRGGEEGSGETPLPGASSGS